MIKIKLINFVNDKLNNTYLTIAFISLFSMSGCLFGNGYDDYVNDKIKPLAIQGKIMGKYKEETGCFGAIIFEQYNQVDTLHRIFYCTPQENKIWSYVLPNDSIYKSKGTLMVYIVRNGIKKEFIFPTRI